LPPVTYVTTIIINIMYNKVNKSLIIDDYKEKNMKKLKVLFSLVLVLWVVLFIACDTDEDLNEQELEKIKVLLPSGAPLISIGGLIGNDAFDIQIAQGADVLNTALISNDYDMIIAPLNLGAKLYLAGKSNYILDSVITTNNTYLVSKNPISSTNDLAGLNLLAYGQNSTPDIILRAALTKHNVTANIGYKGNVGDVLNLFMGGSDEATYSLLAEPQVTIVKKNNPNVYVLDMAKEVEVGKVFPQACLYVKADTKDKYNEHLKLIEENIKYLNENPSEYAAKVEDKHQYFTTMTKEVLTAALPNCNILYLKGNSNKNVVEDYIALLNTYAPALLGGKTVDEGFYN